MMCIAQYSLTETGEYMGSGVGGLCCDGAQNYVKVFVAHKMTQNNTLNKVNVAATVAEYKYVWRGNRTKSLSDFV